MQYSKMDNTSLRCYAEQGGAGARAWWGEGSAVNAGLKQSCSTSGWAFVYLHGHESL